jgi:hypothetical protein
MRVPFIKFSFFQFSSIFSGWWSEISSIIRTFIGPRDFRLRTLKYKEIKDAVGLGLFACVVKIKN